ncbi:MAG: hypothetical protein HKN29_12185 [Rhodothermales bacterium]|nr:hypothetical protein [Rhodothermales bacterium]
MSKIAGVMIVLAAALAWLAIDGDARRDGIRKTRKLTRTVVEEVDARVMMRELREGLEQEDPRQMTLLGYYHASDRAIYPRALYRAMAREFGPQQRETGLDYLRRAVEQGYAPASMYYWGQVGWPEPEVLLEEMAGGNVTAAWRLVADLGSKGCEATEAEFAAIETAAAGLAAHPHPENEFFSNERFRADIETMRAWKAESCEKPAA